MSGFTDPPTEPVAGTNTDIDSDTKSDIESDELHTCVSSIGHSPAGVIDHICHYGSCINIAARDCYFTDKDLWDHERENERAKVIDENDCQRPLTFEQDLLVSDHVASHVSKMIYSTALEIDRELKRINILRHEIHNPKKKAGEDVTNNTNIDLNYSHKVSDAMEDWRKTSIALSGIQRVTDQRVEGMRVPEQILRDLLGNHTGSGYKKEPQEHSQMHRQLDQHLHNNGKAEYDLEKDFKANVIEFKFQKLGADDSDSNTPSLALNGQPPKSDESQTARAEHKPCTCKDTSYLQKYTERDQRAFRGSFPHQKVTIEDLMDPDQNIMKPQGTEGNRVRYIHIPTNNMDWVERAIALFYGDPRPDFDKIHREKARRTQTYNVLRPEYWRGQEMGGDSLPVHSRHMRPMCEMTLTDMCRSENTTRNFTLFMPYLNWETGRKRSIMSGVIQQAAEDKRQKQQRKKETQRQKRIRDRYQDIESKYGSDEARTNRCKIPKLKPRKGDLMSLGSQKLSHNGDLAGFVNKAASHLLPHQSAPARPLARVLFYAAKIYETMALYKDKRMIQTYLFKGNQTFLHPRRTLDQSYYWTLGNTESRDRDQVVFRHTQPRNDNKLRHEEPKKPRENLITKLTSLKRPPKLRCPDGTATNICSGIDAQFQDGNGNGNDRNPNNSNHPQAKHERDNPKIPGCGGKLVLNDTQHTCGDCMNGWFWTLHTSQTDDELCEHCRSDVMKLSRVIMVDQLWMWILDDNTILTCYPKRYGVNKPDPSGVHKSIRTRLRTIHKHELKSVYDLALIILDECTNTFFDRAKARDKQPRLTDIFSESIGKIAYKQTVLFEHLWHWAREANTIYRLGTSKADSSRLHVPLLDIRREGMLQREIKDIIDELDMMIYLGIQQTKVLKRFRRLVGHMIHPDESIDHHRNFSRELSLTTEPGPPHTFPCECKGEEGRGEEGRGEEEKVMHNSLWNRWKKYTSFRDRADTLVTDVEDRIGELEALKKSALSVAENVQELLSLKQQQAGVVQAYESVRQAEETVRQGRSIMMFTIVTIIFLPLSFTAGVFGMNSVEFATENELSLWLQMPIIFGVSGFVIIVTLVFAFSSMVRSIFWSFFKYYGTRLMMATRLYWLWLSWGHRARDIDVMTIRETDHLKEKVRKEKNEADADAIRCKKHKSKKDETASGQDSKGKSTGNGSAEPTDGHEETVRGNGQASTGAGNDLGRGRWQDIESQ